MQNQQKKLVSPITRLVISQFLNHFSAAATGLSILFLLTSVFGIEEDSFRAKAVFAVCSALAMLFETVLVYSTAWKTGERDLNLTKYGHIQKDGLKGLKAGLLSEIPALAMILVCIVSAAGESGSLYTGIFRMAYFPFWLLFSTSSSPYIFLLSLVFVPLVSHWGYINGQKLFSLWRKVVYRSSKGPMPKKKDDKRLR